MGSEATACLSVLCAPLVHLRPRVALSSKKWYNKLAQVSPALGRASLGLWRPRPEAKRRIVGIKLRKAAAAVTRYELLLLGLATPLLLFPGVWSPVGLTIIGVTWLIRLLARGRFSARTAMDVPIILMLIMLGVSLIPSVDLDLSLNRAWVYILGVALFYGMVDGLHSERHIHLMGVGLVLVG